MTDAVVSLGPVTFTGFEIPERINFGGTQRTSVHKLIGGARRVDKLGPDPDDKSWEGRFRGSQALQRAQAVDQMRKTGQVVTLTWGGLSFNVSVASFKADYERGGNEIPYRITVVMEDGESPIAQPNPTVDTLVSNDLGGVGAAIADAQASVVSFFSDLSGPLATASSALGTATLVIGSLNGLAGLPTSQATGILTALSSGQTAINGAIQIGDGNIFGGANEIGGIVPGGASGAGNLITGQIAALQTLSSLVVSRGQIGRAINNVKQAGAS